MTEPSQIAALIVAAGSGTRVGGGLPKQYRHVDGKAVLAHAIDALQTHPAIGVVQVVIGRGQEALYQAVIGSRQLAPPIIGGASRRESVVAGLAAIAARYVLIHDAVRPFVPMAVIDRLAEALATSAGAAPVLPVVDSLAQTGASLGEPVARDGLLRVQTPQAFETAAIRAAHAAWPADRDATDDAQVLRAAGKAIALVPGDERLAKLTYEADFVRVEQSRAARRITRTGMGFDVHAFGGDGPLWLGGVEIPHPRGLAGHSDADVALHALTDALLGAAALGDIGHFFPPSDPRWKGAASAIFVTHAVDQITCLGGIIDHVDLTIICEAPKIGPYRDSIRARIAALLRLAPSRISVKATTTERLGFTGRKEGIAAQAVATVRMRDSDDD